MAQIIRAILLARATAASLRGLRSSKASSHADEAGAPRLGKANDGGGGQHQQLTQPLVTGTADAAEALLAAG